MLLAAQPFTLAASETRTVVFALAMGDGAADLAASIAALAARYAAAVVGVENELVDESPVVFSVGPSYPNPFARTTNIDIRVPGTTRLQAIEFDVLGRKVERLFDETVPAGQRTLTWNASGEPAGVYFYGVTAGSRSLSGRMVVTR